MQNNLNFIKYTFCSIIAIMCVNCTQLVEKINIEKIILIWNPDPSIRDNKMEIVLDKYLLNRFIDIMNNSNIIVSGSDNKIALYEGYYEITVIKTTGEKMYYSFDGDSILFSADTKESFQNKDLHIFIYQILFSELEKRNIKLQ